MSGCQARSVVLPSLDSSKKEEEEGQKQKILFQTKVKRMTKLIIINKTFLQLSTNKIYLDLKV